MRSATLRLCLALITCVLVSGCANQNSIFRKNLAGGRNPVVMTVDAKQRHLIIAPDYRDGHNYWRTCAEAAPDVFSALSTSAAGDLGFGRSGTQTNAQAKAALAIAEAAGTIERTQTINLLRESMYRTCERYLSGAIDQTAFAVQAGRDWRAMIAILAIEQLTRVAKPPATIIAAGSTSATVQSESDAVRQLMIAQRAREDAQGALKDANADFKAAGCDTAPDSAEKTALCDQKQKKVTDAQGALDQAKHDEETWTAVAKSYGTVANSATTGSGQSEAGGVSPSQAPTADLAAVSTTVDHIVRRAFDTDETQLMCIQMLSATSTIDEELKTDCRKYLTTKVKYQASLFGSEANVTTGIEYRSAYDEFRSRLLRKIERTKPEDLAGDIAALEQATRTEGRGIAADCTTIAACKDAVINDDAYRDIYPLKQQAFDEALDAWRVE